MSIPNTRRRKEVNEIRVAPLARWLLVAAMMGGCGFLFVYVKNQQHILGAQTREMEGQIKEEKAYNEVLLARVSALSSRTELQRKLAAGLIALKPIQDQSIARLNTPTMTPTGGEVLRTAANERYTP